MIEKSPLPGGGVPVAVGTQPKPGAVPGGAAVVAGPLPSASVGQPPVAAAKSPALFGGYKGGGKKRADGLLAGSEAAKEVDREKNRLRMVEKRAGEKGAALPPPLARPANAAGHAAAPLAPGQPPLAGAVVGASIGAPVVLPTFVAWTQKMLERPVKLLTKIGERLRVAALMDRVRKLGLPKDVETEAEKRMRYKEEQIADFNAALTNCAIIELNKRTVPGAQHSHWLELAMTGGELVNCHLDTVDWLEKQIIAQAEAKAKAESAQAGAP